TIGMHVAVAILLRFHFAEGGDGVGLLLGAAGVARRFVRVLHRGQGVIGVDVAAGGRGHAMDEFGLLVRAAGQICLQRDDVAAAVIGVFRGFVIGVARDAVYVGLDGFRRAAEIVVERF